MTAIQGDYDRDEETQNILDNPPASVGNPVTTSVLSQLKGKFATLDAKNTIYIRAKNRGPVDHGIWLELDKNISNAEWTEYRESARGVNRAARRGGTGEVDEERAFARVLVEKCVAIHMGHPDDTPALKDDDGNIVTLKDEAWCEMVDHPRNPVGAAMHLFGWGSVRAAAGTLLAEAGVGGAADVVDPTTGSSGD